MGLLSLAALLWIAVHIGLAGTRLRDPFAARLGEAGFRGVFSVLSVISITLLVIGWRVAPTRVLWVAPDGLRWALAGVMLAAFLLLVGSVTVRNPTTAGQQSQLAAEPRGMVRVTRYPMLWSFALWAGAHVAGNGNLASLLFFGAFLVTALAGMPSIDAKLARRDPAGFGVLAARTSILPFGAIAGGRNRFAAAEIGWRVPAIGVALWAGLLYFHPSIFGVAAVPS